jgi:uncharacterized protein YndB with AHSA1/START domain
MTTTTAAASVQIDATPDDVWYALTEPELVRRYFMGATISTDWEVGHPITWAGEWNGQDYQDKGEVLAVEQGRRLTMSHWSPLAGGRDAPEEYHVIDIELEPEGDATRVTLRQSNLVGGVTDADREHRSEYEENWATTLRGLKDVVEEP